MSSSQPLTKVDFIEVLYTGRQVPITPQEIAILFRPKSSNITLTKNSFSYLSPPGTTVPCRSWV